MALLNRGLRIWSGGERERDGRERSRYELRLPSPSCPALPSCDIEMVNESPYLAQYSNKARIRGSRTGSL